MGILNKNGNGSQMLLTCSFSFAILLIVLALANVLWCFLLPVKGEGHPTVQTLIEIERTIKRSEDKAEANWSILKKQIKRTKIQLSSIRPDSSLSSQDLGNITKIVEALLLYVEGNWRLFEMNDDPEDTKRLYYKSQNILKELRNNNLKFAVTIDAQSGEKREINLSNTVADLTNLVRDQIQFLEEEYGI
ncbi:MAG: hypothetical protein QNJ31_02150 [Candidatus Caenarcaniphilales bacterium]|nr:hypothetical protein [Candidatus Caenarcaniphilales bacterium]